MKSSLLSRLLPPLLVFPLLACSAETPSPLLIRHVRVVDGTGAPAREGAVRIADGRIVSIGDLIPAPGEAVRDGRGLVLAPGFIDPHSHHERGLRDHPGAEALLSQGVTTIVVGQDGGSVFPLSELWRRLEAQPVSVNIASYSGHNTLRRAVMGGDYRRLAREDETARMADYLAADLAAGALGLSTGLGYDPGIYSNTEEVIALARVAARRGGRYISHLRSESDGLFDSIDELLRIGREAGLPVQVSHIKLPLIRLWGQVPAVLAKLDAARAAGIDVTFDIYPYEYWQSTMTVALPKRDFDDLATMRRVLAENVKPAGVLFNRFDADPSIVGRTLAQVADERQADPARLYLDLIKQAIAAGAAESIIGTSMNTGDIAAFLRWPWAGVCSDGELDNAHPRGTGSFAKVLRKFVREDGALTLEAAVRKMSGQNADNLGLAGRGYLRPGYAADLVLFDPATITDHASIATPQAHATGVVAVWVNGTLAWEEGRSTVDRPGQPLRRGHTLD